RDAGSVAERREIELLLPVVDDAATPPPLGAGAGPRLFADHAQRQELVPLQAQNRLQALDVVLREEPVTALRPAGGQEPLVLEITDLRDGDVGELVLQPVADRADREEPATRGCFRGSHQRWRKVSRYLPIWSSSPSLSSAVSTRSRLTNVPFRLPWSSTCQRPPCSWTPGCLAGT